MNEIAEHLKNRTMAFAVKVTRFCRALPKDWEGEHVADQLFRSSTSVAANYRATCRARSRREFIAKLGLVVEESDESVFWLVFVERATIAHGPELGELLREGKELLAIFVASARTATVNRQQSLHRY